MANAIEYQPVNRQIPKRHLANVMNPQKIALLSPLTKAREPPQLQELLTTPLPYPLNGQLQKVNRHKQCWKR